jgi:hypothetical protein
VTDYWTDYASEAQIIARDARADRAKVRTQKAIAMVRTGRTVTDVCRSLGMTRATFYLNCKAQSFDIHALRNEQLVTQMAISDGQEVTQVVDPLLL